jgi:glycosyltransferase involved in cell wall biosynthesis
MFYNNKEILLSICIPTFNRADYLKRLLKSLIPQIKNHKNKIEIIISDNCSTDNTYNIIDKYRKTGLIKYHKNNKNIGAAKNYDKLITTLAKGKYCWILGDDEIVLKNAINEILMTIQINSSIDYFYINYYTSIPEPNSRIKWSNYEKYKNFIGNSDLRPRKNITWDKLFFEDRNHLTPIYCSIFNRSLWVIFYRNKKIGKTFSSLINTYPHVIFFIDTFIGKSVYSSGKPLIISGSKISWKKHSPLVSMVRIHELFDYGVNKGLNSKLINYHRRNLILLSGGLLSKLILFSNKYYLSKKIYKYFFKRFWTYYEIWISIPLLIIKKILFLNRNSSIHKE